MTARHPTELDTVERPLTDILAVETDFEPVWSLQTPGIIAWPPLPLAHGVLVVVTDADGDALHLYDDEGLLDVRLPLPSRAVARPARTGPWVCVACDGLRLVLVDLRSPNVVAAVIRLSEATVVGPILGASGRFFARIRPANGAPVMALADAEDFRAPRFLADPFPGADNTRWAATHDFVFCGATDHDGTPRVAAWDAIAGRFLWTSDVGTSRLVALRAVGGRLDILLADRVVTAFGYDLSGRRQLLTGLGFDSSELAGEHILVRLGTAENARVATFQLTSEDIAGELEGVIQIVAADTNHALVTLSDLGATFVSLPELAPVFMHDADLVSDASMAAFGWDTVWVVHGGGQCLTAIARPTT